MWQVRTRGHHETESWANAPADAYWDMGRLVIPQPGSNPPIRYSGGDVRWYTPKRSEEFATLIPPSARSAHKHLRAHTEDHHNG